MKSWKCTFYMLVIVSLFIGINPQSIYAQEETKLAELSLEDLLNMDVTTVSKSEEKQSDAPGILSVVSKDELKRFGGTTLRDILERVPGLIGSTNYMTDRSVISSRGDQIATTSNHVLLLINGRPVREMLEGGITSEMFETFPVNIIERIEVIKGPGSVLYGSNAFSGVVNIITEKAEKTGFSVNGLVGNESAVNVSGDVKIKAGDLSVVAAANYNKKPEWEVNYQAASPMGGTVTKNTTIPNEGTGVYVGANYKGLSVMGAFNQWETSYFVTDYLWLFDGFGDVKWKKYFGNIGYDAEITDIWNTSINVTYSQSKLDVTSWPNTSRNSNEVVAEWTNFVTLSSKSKIIFGGLFSQIEGTEIAGGTTVTDAKRSAFGLYTQIDYSILENLKAIGGIQLNKIENIDLGFVPRIGMIWSPASRVNVKALYSQAFRAPSVNEVSIDFPQMRGTSDLKPEKVGTFDLSVSYQGEQAHASINYFNSKLTDMVYQDRSGAVPTYANYGDASTISGVEFEGKYYVNRNLYLTGSTLYQKAEDNDGNEDITPIANFGAKAGVSYVWDEGVTLSLFDVYQGDIESSLEGTLNTPAGSYNLLYLHSKIDINKVFNLNLKQDLILLVQVNNLLDKQVWLPNWGLTKGSTIPYIQGRTMYIGLNLSI